MTDNDFYPCCIDEIALEGLDGITLQGLWVRLAGRPKFPLALDEGSKSFIWQSIIPEQRLEFYKLEKPRLDLVIYDRYKHVDAETGYVVEPSILPPDIYPIAIVNRNGVRGSCSTFFRRSDITSTIRKSRPTLAEATERWGNSLVIVANQATRERALVGSCHAMKDLDITDIKYAVLERIGRSRYMGQTSQGKQDLKVFDMTNATSFIIRKQLVQRNLITKQDYFQRCENMHSRTGFLLHLPRFYVEMQTKKKMLTQELYNFLAAKPHRREVFKKIRTEMGLCDGQFKKLLRTASQYLSQHTLPYNEFYPDSPQEEWYTKNQKMRMVRVLELSKSYFSDEADAVEEDEDTEEPLANSDVGMFFHPKKYVFDRPRLDQAYQEVYRSGTSGMTLRELSIALMTTRLEARNLYKALLNKKVVVPYKEDLGRQRVTRLFCPEFAAKSELHLNLMAEKKRMLERSNTPCPSKRMRTNSAGEGVSTDGEGIGTEAEGVSTEAQARTEELPKMEKVMDVPNAPQNETESVLGTDQPIITVETDNVLQFNKVKSTRGIELTFPSTSNINPRMQSLQSVIPSYMMLMRANKIIDFVKGERLISDLAKLRKALLKHEENAGYKFKLDKVSLERLLCKLCKAGYIKSIRTTLRMGTKEKKLQLICLPEISKDDDIVKSTIEQIKFKHFAIHKEAKKSMPEERPKVMECSKMVYHPSMGRHYGSQPKFRRMHLCYAFMHYMLYTYDGKPQEPMTDDPSEPTRYQSEISWKTFVAPLPKNPSTPQGWLIFNDILLSLPLSLFVKIVSSIKYKIEGLDEYLQDDVKCHYLIRSLPVKLRNALLFARRYIYSIHETIKRLSFVGLLTFGPQRLKEKDQVYLFIHRRTIIKDTTCSLPGYHQITKDMEYPKKEYFLRTEEDVDRFWVELEKICLCTPLGTVQSMRGQVIELQNLYKKPAMIEACKNKNLGEEVDDGSIPGDQLGAAGFDSALFAHLKRNWNHLSLPQLKYPPEKSGKAQGRSKPLQNYLNYLDRSSKETESNKSSKQKQRLSKLRETISRISVYYPKADTSESSPVAVPVVVKKVDEMNAASLSQALKKKKAPPKKKPHIVTRVLKERKSYRVRKPYYDEKDKAALKKMKTMRVTWTSQEDIILLMCKVASWFLDPHQPKMVVPFTAIRDILHEHCPEVSKDKTSRACQRRLHFMLLNPATKANASVFLCEARQDQALTEMFHGPKPAKSAEEQWTSMLRTVLEHLMVKFSKSPGERHREITLPQTLEELKDRYTVLVSGQIGHDSWSYKEPHNVVDIHFTTVALIVLSSFASDTGKTCWSLTLYRIYEQYPDKLIRSVTARLRHNGVISRKLCHAKKQFNSLNLSMLPFTLSTRFKYELERRFSQDHFVSMGQLLTELLGKYKLGDKLSLSDSADPPHVMLLITLMLINKLQYEIEVPQMIVDFDSRISSDLAKHAQQRKVVPHDSDIEESLPDNSSFADKLKSLHLETTGSGAKTSRSFLYMLRQDMTKALEFRSTRPQDYVIIKPCKIDFILFDDNLIPGCSVEDPTDKSYAVKIRNPVYDSLVQEQRDSLPPISSQALWTWEDILQIYSVEGKDAREAQLANDIYNCILQKKELGITYSALLAGFGSRASSEDLSKHIEVLVKNLAILQIGVTCFRYVAYRHSKPWIVRSIKIPKELRSYATALGQQEHSRKSKMRRRSGPPGEEVIGSGITDVSMMEVDATASKEAEENNLGAAKCSVDILPSKQALENDDQLQVEGLKDSEDDSKAPPQRHPRQKRTYYEAMSRNINLDTLEKVLYVPRLWKKPDGTLNRPILHKFMAAVLSFVMDNPGVTEDCIRSTFSRQLEPCIQTLEVLRMLETLGCISHFYLRSSNTRCTLFSKREESTFCSTYMLGDTICYEGTVHALLHFAAFTTHFLK